MTHWAFFTRRSSGLTKRIPVAVTTFPHTSPPFRLTITMSEELKKQDAKFGYKAPESVYQKHDPKSTMVGSGKAFQGVSPMDFYLRQSAQKKAEKAKEHETKVGTYSHNMYKGSL
jgi:hypothetical protein